MYPHCNKTEAFVCAKLDENSDLNDDFDKTQLRSCRLRYFIIALKVKPTIFF